MSEKENDKLDKVLYHLETLGKSVAKIERGVYGDPDNDVPGLIKENKSQETRIKSLEENQKKQKWIIAGVSFSVPVIIHFVKQKIGL